MKAIPLLRAQLFHLLETGLLQVFLKNTDEVSSSQETLVIKRPGSLSDVPRRASCAEALPVGRVHRGATRTRFVDPPVNPTSALRHGRAPLGLRLATTMIAPAFPTCLITTVTSHSGYFSRRKKQRCMASYSRSLPAPPHPCRQRRCSRTSCSHSHRPDPSRCGLHLTLIFSKAVVQRTKSSSQIVAPPPTVLLPIAAGSQDHIERPRGGTQWSRLRQHCQSAVRTLSNTIS